MDDIDRMILEAINERSPKKWVYAVNVNKALGLEETEFGARLTHLQVLGYIITQSGVEESQIRLTDLGRRVLRGKR